MSYRWRYKNRIYGVHTAPAPPTRGNIFIGLKEICEKALPCLPPISMFCLTAERIVFSLLYEAEQYIDREEKEFTPAPQAGPITANSFCGGDFRSLLQIQKVHSTLAGVSGSALRTPAYVFYTQFIDTKEYYEEIDVGNFIQYFASSWAIPSLKIDSNGQIIPLQKQNFVIFPGRTGG